MQLVAASKMKKAQDQATSGRPYADLMNKVLVNLKENCDEEAHPLLNEGEGDKELVLLITTDKGLCGGLNTNLIRLVLDNTGADCSFFTVGSKGRKSLARVGRNLIADFSRWPIRFSRPKPVRSRSLRSINFYPANIPR